MIQEQINHLESLKDSLHDQSRSIVEKHKEEIIYVLQNEQLGQGLNSFGKVTGVYSEETQKRSQDPAFAPRQPKIAGSPYNFEWFGNLFDGMYLDVKKDGYNILTFDGKIKMLEGHYGKLLGLTAKNNDWVNENIIAPELYEYVLDNLFKL